MLHDNKVFIREVNKRVTIDNSISSYS